MNKLIPGSINLSNETTLIITNIQNLTPNVSEIQRKYQKGLVHYFAINKDIFVNYFDINVCI